MLTLVTTTDFAYRAPGMDYFKEIDLNPAAAFGGPINNPLDARAMHYFGFVSEGQELSIAPPFGGPARVLVSWHYANQPTLAIVPPPPPIDAILDTAAGLPVLRYDEHHERAFVIVWLDPALPPPVGQPFIVRIRTWDTK